MGRGVPVQSDPKTIKNMTENEKTDPRKEARRDKFGTEFTPRRDFSPGREVGDRGAPDAPEAVARGAKGFETVVKSAPPESDRRLPVDAAFERMRLLTLLVVALPLTIYSFWPSLVEMVYKWYTHVDYGHGFFVVPLVALFLYLRLDTYPGTRYRLSWFGLLPILICCAMRYFAADAYIETLDQWSLLFWIFGIVWFFYGSRVFRWGLPSLAFLFFMFPLPWSYENLLRNNLQRIAAQFAAGILQVIGEPAIAINNTVRMSTQELSVDAACSGIRFLISVLAIAFATILLMRRPWWQNVLIIVIAVPLALFVNASRIAMTGILLTHFPGFLQNMTGSQGRVDVLADEIAGITMIFVALGMFFAFIWYLGKVFRRVEI